MEQNTKQNKETCSLTKKNLLCLEARHTISLEASNKIRSNLSPRIFMPRKPVKCQTKKKSWKELKQPKDSNFKESQCEEDTIRRIKGKYTKKLSIENNKIFSNKKIFKTNEEIDLKGRTNGKLEEIPATNLIDVKNVETVKVDNSNTSCMDMQIIENVNSIDSKQYFTDVNGSLAIDSPVQQLHPDEICNAFQNNATNINENVTVPESADTNLLEFENKDIIYSREMLKYDCQENRPSEINIPSNLPKIGNNFEHFKTESPAVSSNSTTNLINSKESLKDYSLATNPMATKSSLNEILSNNILDPNIIDISEESSNEIEVPKNEGITTPEFTATNFLEFENKNIKYKFEQSDTSKMNISSNLPTIGNNFESIKVKNLSVSSNKATNSKDFNINPKESWHKTRSNNILDPNIIAITAESPSPIEVPKNENINKQMPALNDEKLLEFKNDINNTNLNDNKIIDGAKSQTVYSIDRLLGRKSPVRNPLENYLHTVEDFQNTVRSSIPSTKDRPAIDEDINEDLMTVENSVEHFLKAILKSYDDLETSMLKTNSSIEYLRKKDIERRTQLPQHSPQTFLDQTKSTEQTADTLTIFITADQIPTKSITYKTKDILNPKLHTENIAAITSKKEPAKTTSRKATKRKISNDAVYNPNPNQIHMDPHNAINTLVMDLTEKRGRTKTITKKPTAINCRVSDSIPIQNSPSVAVDASDNAYERSNFLRNGLLYAEPYNLMYTGAQNGHRSYLPFHPSNLAAATNFSGSLINNQLRAAQLNNHRLITENVNIDRFPVPLSEDHRPQFNALRQDLNRDPHNITNLNQMYQNYYHQLRVPFMRSPYNDSSIPQNFQMENKF